MADTFELAVRGGTVVTAAGRRLVDLYVAHGRVAAWRSPATPERAAEVLDASGLLVLPGFVDTHVHLMEPGDPTRETFLDGTAAAARSGVTSIIEHTHGWPVTDTVRFREKRAHLQDRAHVDYGLGAHAWPDQLDEVEALWRAGVAFLKVFTCATHGVPAITADLMWELFRRTSEIGAHCLVHAEDDLMTAANERRLRAAGCVDGGLLAEWRSREAELVAAGTTAMLSRLTGASVTLAHSSSPDVLDLVAREQRLGAPMVAETCPQYLLLWEGEALHQGALRKFTPPARISSEDDEQQMWSALQRGGVTILSSDHAPSTREQKADGDLWDVHFGLPGLDTTSSLMVDAALAGKISLERLAEVYSRAPARRYGLPRKGDLRPGYDADMVLLDPHQRRTLRDDDVWSRARWTPYAGREVTATPVATLLRGRPVVREGRLVSSGPSGRFLPGPGAAADGEHR